METKKTTSESENRRILKSIRLLNRIFRFSPSLNLKDDQIAMLPSDRWIVDHLKSAYRNDNTFRNGVQDIVRATLKVSPGPATLLIGGLCLAAGLPVIGLWAVAGGSACIALGEKQRADFKTAWHNFKTKTLPDFSRKTKASYATYRGIQLTGKFSNAFAKNMRQKFNQRKKDAQAKADAKADTSAEIVSPQTEPVGNTGKRDAVKGAFGRVKDRFFKQPKPDDAPNDNQPPETSAKPKPKSGNKPS